MTDSSKCENIRHFVHQDENLLTRVSEFGDDDEVMITTHYDDEKFPYSAEVYDKEQIKFIHEYLDRILNND